MIKLETLKLKNGLIYGNEIGDYRLIIYNYGGYQDIPILYPDEQFMIEIYQFGQYKRQPNQEITSIDDKTLKLTHRWVATAHEGASNVFSPNLISWKEFCKDSFILKFRNKKDKKLIENYFNRPLESMSVRNF